MPFCVAARPISRPSGSRLPVRLLPGMAGRDLDHEKPSGGRADQLLSGRGRAPNSPEPLHGHRNTGGRRKVVELAKPNFNFQKRQKELARKKKQEQKRLLKQASKNADSTDPSAKPADASNSP